MKLQLKTTLLGSLFLFGAVSANAAMFEVQFTSSAGNLDFSSPVTDLNPIDDGLFATLQFNTTTNEFTLNTFDLDDYFAFDAVINSVYVSNPGNVAITPTNVVASGSNAPAGFSRFNFLSEVQDNQSVNFTLSGIDLNPLTATSFALAPVNREPNPAQSVFVIGESIAAVPEPETYAMFLAGLGLMAFVARRKKA